MMQEDAVQAITASLQRDALVQAVFLKGSMGRGEHDAYSDVDLYCLVEAQDEEAFLTRRLDHLKAYGDLLYVDTFFIIAPQILAVYDNLLHVDLFTVTETSFLNKDYFRVLHDPNNKLAPFRDFQDLSLSPQELHDHIDDTAFFLLQYHKAAGRGNDLWAVHVGHDIMIELAKVLLHHYNPRRAQLGLKTAGDALPASITNQITAIFNSLTPERHHDAVVKIKQLITGEMDWLACILEQRPYTKQLLHRMLERHINLYQNEEEDR
ncbi:nucleotidyltransferase domain-containing protein [Thalassobacillus sp. CUG 92003]|uniref:nucleotidyltransferase domain-containing protein n=1 Tax=Thalassobacillus sp. CUG 92003 TaxID=2736641 RepID=UPI0015E64051|nr:nucleotidyltransferase domain-containing protein [Thalassobacillus sp. CUG 92003]